LLSETFSYTLTQVNLPKEDVKKKITLYLLGKHQLRIHILFQIINKTSLCHHSKSVLICSHWQMFYMYSWFNRDSSCISFDFSVLLLFCSEPQQEQVVFVTWSLSLSVIKSLLNKHFQWKDIPRQWWLVCGWWLVCAWISLCLCAIDLKKAWIF